MLKTKLFLASAWLSLVPLPARADGGDVQHAFLSPRKSGEGRIEFSASGNVHLLGWLPIGEFDSWASARAIDCWGYTSPSGREYAIVCLSRGTAWVEVTDPGAPLLIAWHAAANTSWRNVKVYGDNAYVVSDGVSEGIRIYDMSGIDAGTVTFVRAITGGGCTTETHTLAIDTDSGYLYRCGGGLNPCSGGPQGLVVYGLANPDLPNFVMQYNFRYMHDCRVVVSSRPGPRFGHELAFCAANDRYNGGNANLLVLDVTNKSFFTTVGVGTYADNRFSHQVWLTPDQRYAYLNDEQDEQELGFSSRTRIFDVSNPAAPAYVGFFGSGTTATDHNLYVTADKIFVANYTAGLSVFDNTDPAAPTLYGYFDTFPFHDTSSLEGLWSTYPYFPSGTVIGTDTARGLFVWRLGAPTLSFAFPSGTPETIQPGGTALQFEVLENAPGDLQPGTVKLHFSTGGAFTAVAATALGGTLYEASLPALPCGVEVEYYVSARTSAGVTWSDPPAGTTQVHQTWTALSQSVAHLDDLETDAGWLVNVPADTSGSPLATLGSWVLGNPIGTAAQPEDDRSEPGVSCWFTGQGTGGPAGEADIDAGVTTLRSPVMDASGLANPHFSYWRWFSNDIYSLPGNSAQPDDILTVEASNDGGTSWTPIETLGPLGQDSRGSWIHHTARIYDHLLPTAQMRLRFRVGDLGEASIVEAALDDVRIVDVDCPAYPLGVAAVQPAAGPWSGGNVVTITGSGFQLGVTAVHFGAVPATSVQVLTANTLQATVPRITSSISGKVRGFDLRVDVSVSSPGSATLPQAYVYTVPMRTQ